jgi:hypothetical protein
MAQSAAAAASRKLPAKGKVGKTYERPGLSEEEIEEIREAFNLFDTDGSGTWFVGGARPHGRSGWIRTRGQLPARRARHATTRRHH